MNDGVNTIQAVARAIHKDLNAAVPPNRSITAPPIRSITAPPLPQEAVPAVPEAPAVPMLTATPGSS
jgi:hypothetical protein